MSEEKRHAADDSPAEVEAARRVMIEVAQNLGEFAEVAQDIVRHFLGRGFVGKAMVVIGPWSHAGHSSERVNARAIVLAPLRPRAEGQIRPSTGLAALMRRASLINNGFLAPFPIKPNPQESIFGNCH